MSAAPRPSDPPPSLLRRVLTRLTWLRWAALQLTPNYDPAFHRAIVEPLATRFGQRLNDASARRRMLARASAHHLTQIALRSKKSAIGFEAACIAAIVPYLVWQAIRAVFASKPDAISCDGVRLVYRDRFAVNPEIFLIPPELANDRIETRVWAGAALTLGDVGFIVRLLIGLLFTGCAYPVQFALKCAFDLASLRAALAGLTPRYLIVYAEYNCALTVLTYRLAAQGIAIYNVMHGDKVYYANHAFFEVTRCYCWNEFYADLFKREHARAEFRLFPNPAFQLTESDAAVKPHGLGFIAPTFDTLAGEAGGVQAALARQAEMLNALAKAMPVTFRPHPFYAAEAEPMKVLLSSDVTIQDPHTVTARTFALAHEVVAGTYSTLMLEAAHLGRQVVVIRTVQVDLLVGEHFFFKMPNVTVCPLDAVADTVAALTTGANRTLSG